MKKKSPDSPVTPTVTPTDEPDVGGALSSTNPLPPISESETTPAPKVAMPPPVATPTPHIATPPLTPGRVATPMETKLQLVLEDADLGSTGFLTASELRTVLTNLNKVR